MRILWLVCALIFLAPEAWADACVSNLSGGTGNWTTTGTWTSCATNGYPQQGDTATISTGDTVTLNELNLEVDRLIWEGNATTDAVLACSNGATLTIHEWTPTATTDWFVSEFQGDDANTGAESTMGATGPEETWAAGIAHAAVGEHVLFNKGGTYFISGDASFTGGGTVGSFGYGDSVQYGPRPLWNLGASNTLTHTGSNNTTQYHSEISCGDVLHATPIMDRIIAVAPAAIEFQLDVDHTHLPATEPRLSSHTDGTEIGGGPDFILPTTVWDFGDPLSGDWTTGARATSATPWPKNMEMPMPIAFHVYEQPGEYTVTAETRYGGEVVNNSITITITSPDTEWAGADTFCFADITGNGGGYNGCPHDPNDDGTCENQTANCIDTADFDEAISTGGSTGCNIDTDSVRCLFRRGDSFAVSANVGIVQSDDWMIGAFGDTGNPRPIVDASSHSSNVLTLGEAPNGRIVDLVINGDNDNRDSKPIYFDTSPSGQCAGVEFDNLLIANVEVNEFGNGFNFRGNTSTGAEQYRPECAHDNLVIYESAAINATYADNGSICTDVGVPQTCCTGAGDPGEPGCPTGGVDLFMHGSSGAVLGGDYGNRQNHEHGMRGKRISNMVFAHIDLGRIGDATDNQGCGGSNAAGPDGASRHLMTIRNGPSGNWEADGNSQDELAKVYTQRFGLIDNHIGVCADNGRTIMVEPTSNGDDHEFWHSYLVWGNLINPSKRSVAYGGFQGSDSLDHFVLGGGDILIANNAFWGDTGITTSSYDALILDNSKNSSGADTYNQRVHVYNNSFFADSTNSATTTFISIDSFNEDTFVANNLHVDLATSTPLSDSSSSTIECNGGGSGCNPELTSNTAFSTLITGAGPPVFDWFKLQAGYYGTPANNVGVIPDSLGVDIDAYEKCRDGAAPWQGLDNNGATACFFSAFLSAPFWDNADSAVGMNLAWHRWDGPATPFVNMMKHARNWQASPSTCFTGGVDFCEVGSIPYECYTGADHGNSCTGPGDDASCAGSGTCELTWAKPSLAACNAVQDVNGYPTTLDGNDCVYTEWFGNDIDDGAYPTGTWSVLWDGGTTTPPTFSVSGEAESLQTIVGNRTTFDIQGDATSGETPKFGITSLGSPTISNIRIYPPGGVCVRDSDDVIMKHQFCDTARCAGGNCPDTVACAGGHTCVDVETVAENPGDYNDEPLTFHPLWLSRLGQYRMLRFMVWNKTNHSRVTEFSEHRAPEFYTYDRNTDWPGEVPLEVMVQLCNDANADCYLNIPSRATDAHISEYVEYVAYNLNSNLNLYLEWSNEVWNSFEQWRFSYLDALAEPSGFDTSSCPPETSSFAQRSDCVDSWYGKRTYEMCELAQTEFDAAGRSDDLHCVHARRISTSGTEVAESLDCALWTGAPNSGSGGPNCYSDGEIDHLAVNVYFGAGAGSCTDVDPPGGQDVCVGGVFSGDNCSTDADCEPTEIEACADAAADIASKLCTGASCGVRAPTDAFTSRIPGGSVIVYEGGSSSENGTQEMINLTIAADSCLIDEYQDALNDWKTLSATIDTEAFLFYDQAAPLYLGASYDNAFAHRGSNEGEWPKESAIVSWDAAGNNDCWWTGCTIGAPLAPPSVSSDPSIRGGGISGGSISYMELEQRILWNLIQRE